LTDSRKRVFLTGATGNMGRAGLEALLERGDRFEVVALVLPTAEDRRIIAPFIKRGVEVIWGDLTCYEDVLQGVTGADYVLHVGGMVSPLADAHPELTMKVNVGAVQNIVRAISAQPDPDRVHLAYIGSVAQTGNRPAPIHWGRTGDPIKLSQFDTYALSKTIAERLVVDSGLKHWVSLRQTGIVRMSAAQSLDPILFHTPLDGVLEWITARDSGVLLANVCEEQVPPDFWRQIYNIGGGEPNRLTNYEFFDKMLHTIGVRDPHSVVEPHWFALRNFHGHWFSDSDKLESMLHFRTQTLDEYLAGAARKMPWYLRLAGAFPRLVRARFERVARGLGGTLTWFTRQDDERITAYFGSRRAWNSIKGWEQRAYHRPAQAAIRLDHGYDEALPRADFSLGDAREAARFRGGRCLSPDMERGDWSTQLRWRCHAGHEFSASLNLVLMGGHWCPVCTADPANYPELARHSPFFDQVWSPDQLEPVEELEAVER